MERCYERFRARIVSRDGINDAINGFVPPSKWSRSELDIGGEYAGLREIPRVYRG